jgi:FKBP-type peptidyl-prolyl cis-trans isomerase
MNNLFKSIAVMVSISFLAVACIEPEVRTGTPEPGLTYNITEGSTMAASRMDDQWLKVEQTLTNEAGEDLRSGLDLVNIGQLARAPSGSATPYRMTPVGGTWTWNIAKTHARQPEAEEDKYNLKLVLKVLEEVEQAIPPSPYDSIPEDAVMTSGGVGIRTLKAGDGVTFPALDNDIVVYYTLWTADGNMVGSPRMMDQKNIFPLERLITGWQDGLTKMSKGERAIMWVPGDLAYDLRLDRPNAPKGMLIFDIELLDIKDAAPVEEGEN